MTKYNYNSKILDTEPVIPMNTIMQGVNLIDWTKNPEFFDGYNIEREFKSGLHISPFHPLINNRADDSPEIAINFNDWKPTKNQYLLMVGGGFLNNDRIVKQRFKLLR